MVENKEQVKLNDEQLSEVAGGTTEKCEPKPYPFRMDGTNASAPNVVCSDAAHKGSKPECIDCLANK